MTRVAWRSRVLRVGFALAALVAGLALALTLWGTLVDVPLRPLDGVEGDLLFEATRIRGRLPLYTDPAIGASGYGSIPARYYVLYPPLWAWFLSLWPSSWGALVGRAASMLAFWGLLGGLVAGARRECRRQTALAAAFAGGIFSIAEFAGSARPDAVALALAGIALYRTVRRAELDALSGALFAIAAWTKPNIVGMAAGAFASCAYLSRSRVLKGTASAVLTSLAVAAVLHHVSGGTWVEHVFAGAGQPLDAGLLVHHLAARAQFFALFLGLAGFFAAAPLSRSGLRAEPEALIALASLVAAGAWALLTFAKIGSAANYWMEPCVAAVVVFSRFEAPPLTPRAKTLLAIAVPFQVLWTGVGSMRATLEWVDIHRQHRALLTTARTLCRAGPDRLVVSDEPGIELMLDGRIVAHAFPLTHQILRGRLDAQPWLHDLGRREIGCVVTAHDRIERPRDEVDADYDYFTPEVRAALFARFAPVATSEGWEVYAPR